MSSQWTLLFDVTKCTGCRNCFVAVKDEYVGNERPGYFAPQPANGHVWLTVEHHESGPAPFTEVSYVLKTCQHCDDAPCIRVATGGAVAKRADGIVIIDPQKARGQRQIVEACPYQAVSWNEDAQLPQAWPFDAHLFDHGWTKTRAEQVCVTGALASRKLDSAGMESHKQAGWQQLRPELNTLPRVLYKGLGRVNRIFVAGALECERDGVRSCLENASIQLVRDGQSLGSAASDAFGDFKIGGIEPGGAAQLRIAAEGCIPLELTIDLATSSSIGRCLLASAY